MTLAARLLALAAIAATASCRRAPVTQDECDRLLDRYTELLVKIDEPKATSARLEAARVEARARAMKNAAFASCTREVSRESMDCALGSFDVDQIERCLIPMP